MASWRVPVDTWDACRLFKPGLCVTRRERGLGNKIKVRWLLKKKRTHHVLILVIFRKKRLEYDDMDISQQPNDIRNTHIFQQKKQ